MIGQPTNPQGQNDGDSLSAEERYIIDHQVRSFLCDWKIWVPAVFTSLSLVAFPYSIYSLGVSTGECANWRDLGCPGYNILFSAISGVASIFGFVYLVFQFLHHLTRVKVLIMQVGMGKRISCAIHTAANNITEKQQSLDDLFAKVRDTNKLATSFASGLVRDYVALHFTQTFAGRLKDTIRVFAIRHMNGFIPALKSCRKFYDITTLENKDSFSSETHPSNSTKSVKILSKRLKTDGLNVVSIIDWFEIDFSADLDGTLGADHLERWFRVSPTLENRSKGLETLLLEIISPHVVMLVDAWNNEALRKAVQHCRLDYSYPVKTFAEAIQLAGSVGEVRNVDWLNGPRTDQGELYSIHEESLGRKRFASDPVAELHKGRIVGPAGSTQTTFQEAYNSIHWSAESLGAPGYFVTWRAGSVWRSVFVKLERFHSMSEEGSHEWREQCIANLERLRAFYPFADRDHVEKVNDSLQATLDVNNTAFLGCYLADSEKIKSVAGEINRDFSDKKKDTEQKIYIMYVASWLYPAKRPIFEIQPRYFGDLDWINFLHRDAKEPHVALYGVNYSADGESADIFTELGSQAGVKASRLQSDSDGSHPSLLTTSDTIMCFWEPVPIKIPCGCEDDKERLRNGSTRTIAKSDPPAEAAE